MTARLYFRTGLTGNDSGDLDSIDGNIISDGDAALVVTTELAIFYKMDATSGATPSSPTIIAPAQNAGNKRWLVVDVYGSGEGGTYILPHASPETLGGIRIGDGLIVDGEGIVSVVFDDAILPIASAESVGGIRVGDRLSIDQFGILSAQDQSYTLPIASSETLGGVKVGARLSISGDGTLSADVQSGSGGVVDLDGFTTDDLAEGSNHLYHTSGRVVSVANAEGYIKPDANNEIAVSVINLSSANNYQVNGTPLGNFIGGNGLGDLSGFNTDDLSEGTTHLYHTSARVITVVNNEGYLKPDHNNQVAIDIINLTSIDNYRVNNIGLSNFISGEGGSVDLSTFTTDDLAEGVNNLYFPGFSTISGDYDVTVVESSDGTVLDARKITQAQYDGITPSATTVYFIVD